MTVTTSIPSLTGSHSQRSRLLQMTRIVSGVLQVLVVMSGVPALLQIAALAQRDIPTEPISVLGWRALAITTLVIGVAGLPALLDLLWIRRSWQVELLALQVAACWLPFAAWLLLCPDPAALTRWIDPGGSGLLRQMPVLILLGSGVTVLALLIGVNRIWRGENVRDLAQQDAQGEVIAPLAGSSHDVEGGRQS